MLNKPYFPKDVVDKIVSVVLSEVESEGNTVDEGAIRTYVTAPKTAYENSVLSGVAEGLFLATIKENEFAYKVKPPTDEEIDDLIQTAQGKAEQSKQVGEYKPAEYPPIRSTNPRVAVRYRQRREQNEATKKSAFERSKAVPSANDIKQTINIERAQRLSHALNWTTKSPKLKATATKKETE